MSVDAAEIRQVIGERDGCFRRVRHDGAINLQLSAMRRALRRDGRPTHSSRKRQLSVQCLRKCDVAMEHGFAPDLPSHRETQDALSITSAQRNRAWAAEGQARRQGCASTRFKPRVARRMRWTKMLILDVCRLRGSL